MKKWSRGMSILALASILVLSYCFMGKPPQRQSAYDFFNNHPPDNSTIVKGSDETKSSHTKVIKVQSTVKKKPRLIDVEGLGELYTLSNISEQELKALLVWAQMRFLLSRSDALSKTAQGIKEAAMAWKEVMYVIEEEKASKFSETSNNSDIQKLKDCPYPVSTFLQVCLYE